MPLNTENMMDEWFELSNDLLCVANRKGEILKTSPSWAKLLGWAEEDLKSIAFLDLVHPDDQARTRVAFKTLLETGSLKSIDLRLFAKNGQFVWLNWQAHLRKEDTNSFFAIARDISEAKKRQLIEQNHIRLLEMAEQTARVGHWHLDVDTGFLTWSNEVFNIYGRRPNKRRITLDDFIDAFSPSHQKQLWDLIQDAIHHGTEINTELTLKKENNEKRTVAMRAVCEKNSDNTAKGLFGVIQDVTEEREHQARLHSKEELLSMAFKATSDGIWDWDLQTDQVWFSPQWKKQLGYDEDEIINRFESWANLIFDDDRVTALEEMENHFRGASERFEMVQRFRHKQGHTVFILVRAFAVRDEKGRAIRMIGAHTDVTELKQLEQAKSEFTSIVSHELRTPLTAIHGAIGLLKGPFGADLSDQAKKLVDMACNNSDRLNLLVNDILDMDKLQSNRMDFLIDAINLDEFLPQVVENHLSYGEKYNVRIDYETHEHDLIIMADRDRLMQVMANLLSNAIKFSNTGELVKIRAYERNKRIAISVIDTGRGIPAEMREKIFEKFIQADSSDQRHKGGTGLGLAISKTMIEKMDGTISLISKVGEGSTFTVALPKEISN